MPFMHAFTAIGYINEEIILFSEPFVDTNIITKRNAHSQHVVTQL